MGTRVLALWILMTIVVAAAVAAQTAPCGRTIVVVTAADKEQEERFLPAPPQHVKDSVVRALPAVGAQVKKVDGLKMEAESRKSLTYARGLTNSGAGVGGHSVTGRCMANGTSSCGLRLATGWMARTSGSCSRSPESWAPWGIVAEARPS